MRLEILENSAIIGNNKIRTLIPDDCSEVYFMAKDVALALGYKDTSKAVTTDTDERSRVRYENVEGGRNAHLPTMHPDTIFITESGIYDLVFGSKLPAAKEFRWWVVSDVLPSIRKTGRYALPGVMEAIDNVKDEKLRQLSEKERKEGRTKLRHKSNIVKDPKAVLRGRKGGLAAQENIRQTRKDLERKESQVCDQGKEITELREKDVMTSLWIPGKSAMSTGLIAGGGTFVITYLTGLRNEVTSLENEMDELEDKNERLRVENKILKER
ncbi:Hypothetical predicted protein [Paramuricea clavata]|uniref:Uncharacterized protein n=1 Tax=Paramuricea clavata TaxID=317549 RepID=A0A7D9KY74_PARCT|nr:Hypothetical predicted protein [Paramuricea clavata]